VSPAQTKAFHVLAKLLSDRHSRARSRRFRLAHSGSIRRLCRRHRLSEARRACSTSCLAREGAMIEDCCVARQGRLTSLGRRCQHHAVITFTAFRRAGANSDRQNRHHKDGATSSLPPGQIGLSEPKLSINGDLWQMTPTRQAAEPARIDREPSRYTPTMEVAPGWRVTATLSTPASRSARSIATHRASPCAARSSRSTPTPRDSGRLRFREHLGNGVGRSIDWSHGARPRGDPDWTPAGHHAPSNSA
jgi:hypothetical protein